ncbi:MAG: queuosine precursor transporter [Candidatus Gracilibacteria bacterium]|nr:queuosine precursor transporter [Candidatus Gracilibacteria bacterium]MDD3120488.1 queuosine precursor transporter [Candidatus Gracilibacteria bacterium]MDD4530297.1 queuosine precursor transporter [Candidatus Gracilibacteria bacterium]
MQKYYKYYTFIAVLFVMVLLVSNIVSTKILNLGPFTFDGGTLLFPLSYIFGDIITEVYGYKQGRKIIWMGFLSALIMSIIIIIVGILPPAQNWPYQEAYSNILGLTPRIVVASLIAYFVGEFSNSYTLSKLKIFTKGKILWARTIGSTIIGELLDTLIFITIAFYGVFETNILIMLLVSNYVFKVGVEIMFTPITYFFINKLKKAENEDYYDIDTDFNPFKVT